MYAKWLCVGGLVNKHVLSSIKSALSFFSSVSSPDIFDQRCSLVNKDGVCHQCSELNGWFNPKQNQQEALMKVKMVKQSKKYDRAKLFEMRTQLVRSIDPLRSSGYVLQEALIDCNRMAMGEAKAEGYV